MIRYMWTAPVQFCRLGKDLAPLPGLLLLALVVVGDGRRIVGGGSTIAGLAE
jgi:hypothetical protein